MSNVQITKRHNNVTVDKSSPAHLLLGEEVKASIHPPLPPRETQAGENEVIIPTFPPPRQG